MTRPAITFDMAQAHQVHDVLSSLISGIGQPQPYNPLGVVTGSLFPIIVPAEEILRGHVYGEITSAVYVITNDIRTVRYVGSVDRSSPALRNRIRAHLAPSAIPRQAWTGVGLIRVPDDLPHRKVLLCEGWAGRVLDPLDNVRLPLVGGRPWTPRRQAA
ncbi:GIY-YIG nuclease family protein [Streptosporangium canum]|uniref:GIY-YIG nuclease family protein n=1 Tax=Streptosporangium canum TaxID=324952 RepID=UPI0036C2715C